MHGEAADASSSKLPTAHAVQAAEPRPAYVPTAQIAHSVDGARSSSYKPARQDSHAAASIPAYVPMLQGVQLGARTDENVPFTHELQFGDP
eukprot:SAG22_NODE_13306_length_411_cov_0.666667_1_plen_90_part_10